jgi:YD repeat-containing protein
VVNSTLGREVFSWPRVNGIRYCKIDSTEKVKYNYDPATLKLSSKAFGNGMKTDYSYDREGRIQGITLRDAAGRIQKVVGCEWNAYGQMARRYLKGFELPEAVYVPVATNGNALSSGLLVQEYEYDAIGRLVAVKCSDAGPPAAS